MTTPMFFVHAGATIFFMRHFLIRGLEILETPVFFGTGRGENVGLIDVISPVAYVQMFLMKFFCLSAMYITAFHMSQFVCSMGLFLFVIIGEV